MTINRVLFSSASDHWATPPDVYRALYDEFKFTCDPCPLMFERNGLIMDWIGSIYCNPPYSNIKGFLEKGRDELANGNAEVIVYLIPSRTDTKWFHEYCMKADEIRFLRGRLKFGDAKNNAPFPSMVVIFNREQT